MLKDEPIIASSYDARRPTAQREANINRTELGEATLESLLDEMARQEAKADPNESDTRLYLQLKALVSLHPETSLPLAKMLGAAKMESRTLQLLAGVFSEPSAMRSARAALPKTLSPFGMATSLPWRCWSPRWRWSKCRPRRPRKR